MHGPYEEATLERDVAAIQIPDGTRIKLDAGSQVMITQELGGAITVMTEFGAMYRLDPGDADAVGREVEASSVPEEAPETAEEVERVVWEQMKKCYDPEIPVNIVELGLVYDCRVESLADGGFEVDIKMTLTAPGCGMGPVLAEDVRSRVTSIPGVHEARVEVVLDPPWNPNMMTEAARLQLGFM